MTGPKSHRGNNTVVLVAVLPQTSAVPAIACKQCVVDTTIATQCSGSDPEGSGKKRNTVRGQDFTPSQHAPLEWDSRDLRFRF